MKLASQKQRQGDYYEQAAAIFLQQQGLQLLAKNWHYLGLGELDLVMVEPIKSAQQFPCLVIVEVRQRKGSQFGHVEETITPAKQRKIINTAQAFLLQYPTYEPYDIRFDVVTFATTTAIKDNKNISLTDLAATANWLKAAFLVG